MTCIWLSAFAYRIDLTFMNAAAPVIIVLLISMSTVLAHIIRAARMNPIVILRKDG